VKNLVDTRSFTLEVCVVAPQTSAGSHHGRQGCGFSGIW